MRRHRHLRWVFRFPNMCSITMGLALALSGSFTGAAQDAAPGKTAPSDTAQPKAPEPVKPPANPPSKPQPFTLAKDQLVIEYWTVRDSKTGVASIVGGQLNPTTPNLVLQADPNTQPFVAVLVTMEFSSDKTSKVYVLGGPIEVQAGKYEIAGEILAHLVGRLLSDINAALPLQFDPSKAIPLDGTAKVKVTPILRVTPADPLANNGRPKLDLGQPVELTLKVSTKRKLGQDEKQP